MHSLIMATSWHDAIALWPHNVDNHLKILYRVAQILVGENFVANLAKRMSFANILPSQAPDSPK